MNVVLYFAVYPCHGQADHRVHEAVAGLPLPSPARSGHPTQGNQPPGVYHDTAANAKKWMSHLNSYIFEYTMRQFFQCTRV